MSVEEAGAAFSTVVAFLRGSSFTTGIDQLEYALKGVDGASAGRIAVQAGLTEDLLRASLVVRRDVGRVSDVIHAAVITLALPKILEHGEVIKNRPSLGPGNDLGRPFDLETNLRVAEFKVAVWSGGDTMRKRGVVADLLHLLLDESGRRRELWVAGQEPMRFLRTSTSTVSSLLSRSSRHLREKYETVYGHDDLPLKAFVDRYAGDVQFLDLAEVLPAVAEALT